ncbi:hypothetical protein [Cytobacillus dafuensis]|uniref:Uncharacterized protein n=1 Tax=Cytobacillus dafuensis TaxID=1742359 RepID=A0A5B8Z527_CYTDA|nr:hypothetical protein [Cytobacillus dafuensis]QED47977.1 hypothetical protein FSZ17_12380 [Cytobacillus dafuensis]
MTHCGNPVNRSDSVQSNKSKHLVIHKTVEVITTNKTIYDHAAEITRDVIKARGEAIDGDKDIIEIFLSDQAVTNLYKKVFRGLNEQLFLYESAVWKYNFLPPSSCYHPNVFQKQQWPVV